MDPRTERRGLAALALLALLAPIAAGAPPARAEQVPSLEERIRLIEAEESDVRVRHRLRYGARLSHPLLVSGSVGGMWAGQPEGYACAAVCDFSGPDWTFEAGVGGARLGVGWSRAMAGLAPGGGRLARIYLAAGGQVGVLRTWGDARLHPRGQTFVGASGGVAVAQVQFRAGVYRNVERDASAAGAERDRWLYTFGIGYGF